MGANVGNTRLAGDAAGRQRAANEGIRMRREALNRADQGGGSGPAVVGEEPGSLPSTIARQEAFAAQPGQVTAFEQSRPQFAPGLEANPPGRRMARPFAGYDAQMEQKGSPEYEQVMQKIRGLAQMRNTGSKI